MSRSTLTTIVAALAISALAGCQATSDFFSPEDEAEPVTVAETPEPVAFQEQQTASMPAYQPPTYQQPIYQQPVYQQPGFQQPAYPQPAYQPPAYQPPAYQQQPAYRQQPYPQPAYPQPAYEPPVTARTVYQPPASYYPPQPNYPPAYAAAPGGQGLIARGEYLVSIGSCTDCHTDGALIDDPEPNRFLAGSHVGINVPGLGVMYAPNLTPDRQSGLGSWSVQDIARALRGGIRPDGSPIRPPMPVANISQLTEEDAIAIGAYLKSIRPVYHITNNNPVAPDRANYTYLDLVDPMD